MQLLAQRRAIDAERGRSLALVAAVPREHFAEQRRFDFVEHERVQAFARLRFDVREVTAHGSRDDFAQCRLKLRFMRGFGAQDADGIHEKMAPLDFLYFPERPVRISRCTRGRDISAASVA